MRNKILGLLLISLIVLMFCPIIVNATIDPNEFKDVKKIDKNTGPINTFAEDAVSAIRIGCVGIAVATVIFQGIKYMTASVESKAQIKQQMLPLAIGLGVLFLATTIAVMIANIGASITD